MDVIAGLLLLAAFLYVLYFVIRTAVRDGIVAARDHGTDPAELAED